MSNEDSQYISESSPVTGFGHGGYGGSLGLAIPEKRLAIAISLNRLNSPKAPSRLLLTEILKHFGLEKPSKNE